MADDPTPPPGATPSNSTIASGIGGAVAVVIIAVLNQFGIHFEAGVEAALAVIVSTLAGYLPKAGRQ